MRTTNSRFKDDNHHMTVMIPLKRRIRSNISVDRYSEQSLHDVYIDKSCSEFSCCIDHWMRLFFLFLLAYN